MKINKTILEHYFVALLIASVSIWRTGDHRLKDVAWSAVVAVLGPVAISAYNHLKSTAAK